MPVVDIVFRITGTKIPVDHGFHLFAAISRVVPSFHGDSEIGVHPISGRLVGNRRLALTERSALTLRLPSERISEALKLAGAQLDINGCMIRTGPPNTRALIPAARLHSPLVIIKGFMAADAFLEAVRRQLQSMAVQAEPRLAAQPHIAEANQGKTTGSHSPYLRRTIRIRDKEIVGFAVRINGLTAEESIRVQENGLGGRRRFGCGVFMPNRK